MSKSIFNNPPAPKRVVPKSAKQTIQISGVWLRTEGASPGAREVAVLVEVNGQWRKLGVEHVGDGETSHIWETLGIIRAPPDDL